MPVLARMEARGISVDRQILTRLSGEFAQKAAALEDEIYELAGERFTIGSPKQLGEILFGKMGLPGGTKTKTGQWSTTAQVLEDLAAEGHELPRKIVDWRQLTKLKSTYTDALPGYINPETKRVHTSYSLASTTTGRLSSSEPNLQNIPVRTAEGRSIRTAFVAEPGNKLVSADYSQIELRVLAHVADIPQLEAGLRRRPRHPRHDGVRNVRRAGRGHAGRGAPPRQGDQFRHHLRHLGLRPRQPARHRARARPANTSRPISSAFPASATTWSRPRRSRANTAMSRRSSAGARTIPEIRSSNPSVRAFNERAAINAPIQGSAADIIRRAMIRMEDALATGEPAAHMLLQVHDELIFEVPEAEVDDDHPGRRRTSWRTPRCRLSRMRVPLQVDARAADNWDEAH